ncbi:hypothetical protein B0H10DRAFT_2059010, partial [Mycena sp. CBHHK59/15]
TLTLSATYLTTPAFTLESLEALLSSRFAVLDAGSSSRPRDGHTPPGAPRARARRPPAGCATCPTRTTTATAAATARSCRRSRGARRGRTSMRGSARTRSIAPGARGQVSEAEWARQGWGRRRRTAWACTSRRTRGARRRRTRRTQRMWWTGSCCRGAGTRRLRLAPGRLRGGSGR